MAEGVICKITFLDISVTMQVLHIPNKQIIKRNYYKRTFNQGKIFLISFKVNFKKSLCCFPL